MDMPSVFPLLNKINGCCIQTALLFIFSFSLLYNLQAQPGHWMNIRLQSAKDKALSIKDVMGESGAVLLFLDPDCPVSQKYGATIRKISASLMEQGIQTIAIYPVVNIEASRVQTFAEAYDYDFIHLLDPKMILTREIKASVTPEAFLLNPSGEVLYQGAIDNWYYELGRYRRIVSRHYLKDAATAYLKQEPIKPDKTEAIGCIIGTIMEGESMEMHH